MKTIKFVNPELTISESVAIVGSSGILRGSNSGKLIDGFNEVVRFNRAPTKNYEADVGSNTTIRIVNGHVLACVDISNEGFTNQPPDFVKDLRDINIISFPGVSFGHIHESCKNYLFNNDYRKLPSVLNEKIKGISTVINVNQSYSLGMLFITVCVLLDIVPHLFGMDIENRRRDHYWEERPEASNCHDLNKEHEIIKKLIEFEKVIYHG